MKRKLVVTLLVSGAIVSSLVTECGNIEAAPSPASTTQVLTIAVTEESSNKNADYLFWTGKEWKSASDEEKKEVGQAYLTETMNIAAKAAGQDLGEAAEATITSEAVSATVDILK